MAKVLKNYKPPKRKSGRVPIYPWSTWLDGKTRRLTRGQDFQCELATMDDNCRKAAKACGLKVRVNREPETHSIVVRAFKVDGKVAKRLKRKPK